VNQCKSEKFGIILLKADHRCYKNNKSFLGYTLICIIFIFEAGAAV
jgi:hypothetical protein